jgi:DNA invertase Pin-like site-specific DNA recombinase
LIFGIFISLAKFKRELITKRTKANFASARTKGCLGGRPRNPPTLKMAMTAIIEVAKKLGTYLPTTLYEYVSPKKLATKLLKIPTI